MRRNRNVRRYRGGGTVRQRHKSHKELVNCADVVIERTQRTEGRVGMSLCARIPLDNSMKQLSTHRIAKLLVTINESCQILELALDIRCMAGGSVGAVPADPSFEMFSDPARQHETAR